MNIITIKVGNKSQKNLIIFLLLININPISKNGIINACSSDAIPGIKVKKLKFLKIVFFVSKYFWNKIRVDRVKVVARSV